MRKIVTESEKGKLPLTSANIRTIQWHHFGNGNVYGYLYLKLVGNTWNLYYHGLVDFNRNTVHTGGCYPLVLYDT